MKKSFMKIASVMNLKGKPFNFFPNLTELQPPSKMATFK